MLRESRTGNYGFAEWVISTVDRLQQEITLSCNLGPCKIIKEQDNRPVLLCFRPVKINLKVVDTKSVAVTRGGLISKLEG